MKINIGDNTTPTLEPASLYYKDITKAIELLTSILYYQTTYFIDRGFIYLIKENFSDYVLGSPEYIVVHLEDFDRVKEMLYYRRLVDLKEWRK